MSVIGLEISDAGIMAAGSAANDLLAVDGKSLESPGYALSEKNLLHVGRAAASKAHISPRYTLNTFWDQLNTEILKQPGFEGSNHSELAFAHLAQIWDSLRKLGDEIIVAIPEYFTREQLGLILSMAKELSMPVRGFVPMALAASSKQDPGSALVFMDTHLHRTVITLLAREDRLFQIDSETLPGQGLYLLFDQLASSVSRAFIQQTRFDPFHRAASEQELYNRLPEILQHLRSNASTAFQMRAGAHMHQISITRELLVKIIEPLCDKILQIMDELQHRHGKTGEPITLQVTHRAGAFFAFEEIQTKLPTARFITCEPGSAALGVLQLANQFDAHRGVSLISSRPWVPGKTAAKENRSPRIASKTHPTHLLYQSVAYPITGDRLLVVGKGKAPDRLRLCAKDDSADLSQDYCSLKRQDQAVFLMNHNNESLFIDGNRVVETARLRLGQHIRIGNIEESLQLIACENSHET